MRYVVRDAAGTPVDAASGLFTFQGSATGAPWRSDTFNTNDTLFAKAPGLQEELKSITALLTTSRFCTFPDGATLSVVMAGRTMDLKFNIEQSINHTDFYLVDGLPFQEGRFEITLPLQQGQLHFFPAAAWTKK